MTQLHGGDVVRPAPPSVQHVNPFLAALAILATLGLLYVVFLIYCSAPSAPELRAKQREQRLARLVEVIHTPRANGTYNVVGTVYGVSATLSNSYNLAIITVSDDGKKWHQVGMASGLPGNEGRVGTLALELPDGATARYWRVTPQVPPGVPPGKVLTVAFLR